MIYFLISKKEGGRLRVFPLSGQQFGNASGESVNPTLHVQCSMDVRNAYPEGTVFATDILVPVGGKNYSAGAIFPLVPDSDVIQGSPANAEMKSEWNEYQTKHPDWKAIVDGGLIGGLFDEPEPETEKVKVAKPKAESETKQNVPLIERLSRQYPCPDIAHDGFYVDPLIWNVLLRNIDTGENTLIYGCQGLGKTELVLTLGKRLGKPVKVYDMGSMHDPMSQMLGTHRLVSDGKNTVSKFDMARFTQDIQEDCIVLLDELNRAPSTTLNILFPLLDSRKTLPVEMASCDESRNVKVHPKCRFIATANIGSRHVGTLPLDPAMMSRFLPVELKQMDDVTEALLLVKRTGISGKDAKAICSVATITRNKVKSQELSVEMSPRETLRCAGLVRDGFPLIQALELAFLYMYNDEEREIVRRMFTTR